MSDYTPGPWRVVHNSRNCTINVVSAPDADGESVKIALVNFRDEANARLIASAPDLDAENSRLTADLAAANERFDLEAHLTRQKAFSERTFGPGMRTKGVCDHIRKELAEIEADPADIMEWVDVIILAFDGAWRAGWKPREIIEAIVAKQAKNEGRKWPDWRTAAPDKAIEHDRSEDARIDALAKGDSHG